MSNDQKVTRKLRAILSADVKGYSILMADDEAFTIQTIKKYRNIISSSVEQHAGRVVDSPGDNILAEFASAVDAVQCAVEIQKRLKKENDRLIESKRLEFRIGINIGDVVHDGDRIYGDGVNLAARIEGLADPGGVCISRSAYGQIKKKVGFEYANLGEQSLKNIDDPVEVYKVLMTPVDAGKPVDDVRKPSKAKWIVAVAAVTSIIIFVILWQLFDNKPTVDKKEAVQHLTPVSSAKPSIAVLPFDNMSDDKEQEYFSDGMTDDIITDLSKRKDLLVISRNSTFTYKGKGKKVPEIAKELNVRYVLEGSVRRAGDQVRINAQLIDAKKDHQIWAERYDDTFQNIFELQDKITKKIVSELALKLSPDEANRIASKGTDSTIAHDMYLKGQAHLRRWTPDDLVKAINYFKQAVEVDPDYSQAYVGLAQALENNFVGGRPFFAKTGYYPESSRNLMRHYIELAMKKPTPGAYSILAILEMRRRHYNNSINLAEKAVALAPNDADALRTLGNVLTFADRPKEAIEYLKEAIRLNPLEGHLWLGFAYMSMQKYEKALESLEHSLAIQPTVLTPHMFTAVSYAHIGREEEAKEAYKKYLPMLSVYYPKIQGLYFDFTFKNPDTFNRFVEGLVKAGYEKDPQGYYEVNEANKLKGQEIKELLIGKTTTGDNYIGSVTYWRWSEHWSEEGVLEYKKRVDGVTYIGEYWVEGDALCQRFENRFEGVKHCFDVYYNHKGNITGKYKYLKLGDFAITPFSIGG